MENPHAISLGGFLGPAGKSASRSLATVGRGEGFLPPSTMVWKFVGDINTPCCWHIDT